VPAPAVSPVPRPTVERAQAGAELLDTIVAGLFTVGLSLQAAMDSPGNVARQRVLEAAGQLDEIIREIRDAVFDTGGQGT
jgi:signal transduction histidine kinase